VKITRLEVFPIGLPYGRPYEQATGTAEMAKRVIVKVHTDEGIVGLGEASTVLPDRTGESAESITVILVNHLGPLLLGEDPLQIQSVMHKLRRASMDKYGFPYSKAALDIALHDIAGKALNVPVAVLLGGIVRSRIAVSRSVPIKSPDETAEEALKLKALGYALLTVKVGLDPEEDLKRVAAVRRAVGDGFRVEVDANQGYRADVAVRILRRMEDHGIENVEQPCPWWDLHGMAEVTRALDTTVTADESVITPADAMNVVRLGAADAITIKLAKCGGFLPSKRIAAVAETAGLSCNMGSQHPAGIGTAAMCHFWASTPEITDVGYGAPGERFADDVITNPIRFADGMVHLPEGPGLGVDVDDEKLARYAIPVGVGSVHHA
jgi:L-alanine-DL-glutamate epimerase-like enolase superfamily enzyme